REHDTEQEGNPERLTDRVDLAHRGRARLRAEERGKDDRGRADRQVDPEHRPPADILDQHAANHRAKGHRDSDDGTPRADGTSAFHPAGKIVKPIWNTRRRPNRSAVAPANSSRDASTSV